ncbi:hypothetical protein HYR99_25730 [Candidatus Poribacteria bacterium]|nr:hypothetical protein [Candidatus Poribacteria bacterium]
MGASQLTTAFQKFQENPLESFRARLRLKRARQLRLLFSIPERVDLNTFNREVWRFETCTVLRGKNISGTIFGTSLQREQIIEFEKALNSGDLELHGNYVWGSGTQIYYPRLKDDAQKIEYIRQALNILNDETLKPLEKAKQILAIPGFGRNSTTGLVMVFHPTEFAIYNKASEGALKKLGYSGSTLEEFEETVHELKDKLGAENFMELDWFLYLRNNPPVPPEETDPKGRVDRHTEIQWLLAKMGQKMGCRVWIAVNDQNREWKGERLGDLSIPTLPFLGIGQESLQIISRIDVLWLRGDGQIVAAFEIEHTTSVYSGLLRMADLVALVPILNFPLYIVTPEERLKKVRSELSRPTFRKLGLHKRCGFFSDAALMRAEEHIMEWPNDPTVIEHLAERIPDR